jgi:hypothetical protein
MTKFVMLALVAAAPALFATIPTTNFKPGPATGTASVIIYAPVQLSKIYDLNFGSVLLNDMVNPAAVAVDPGMPPNYVNLPYKTLVNVTPRAGSTCGVAHFDMWRDANLAVTVSASPVVPLTSATGQSVTFLPVLGKVSNEFDGIYAPVAGTVFEHFNVGGTVNIPAATVGAFSGPFTVTANYN